MGGQGKHKEKILKLEKRLKKTESNYQFYNYRYLLPFLFITTML